MMFATRSKHRMCQLHSKFVSIFGKSQRWKTNRLYIFFHSVYQCLLGQFEDGTTVIYSSKTCSTKAGNLGGIYGRFGAQKMITDFFYLISVWSLSADESKKCGDFILNYLFIILGWAQLQWWGAGEVIPCHQEGVH